MGSPRNVPIAINHLPDEPLKMGVMATISDCFPSDWISSETIAFEPAEVSTIWISSAGSVFLGRFPWDKKLRATT